MFDAVRIHAQTLQRRRLRGDGDHVFGAHKTPCAFAQAFEQALAFVLAVAIGLVQREQQWTFGACKQLQRVALALGHVAIDNEDDQVADASHFEREFLARLTIEFVNSGSVDQMHAAASNFAPAALAGLTRRAVQHADREHIFAEQRIGQRGFADADAPEYGDVQLAAFELAEHGFEACEIPG